MKTFAIVWLISWLLLYSEISYAQSESPRFEHISEKQGVAQSEVWSFHQDSEGFMWFGTGEGLYKYDGQAASLYQADPTDPEHSLRQNRIYGIQEGLQGRLWVATWGGGLHEIDKWTGKVMAYPVDSTQTKGWDQLESICKDRQGILWLGSALGIARFDPATKKYTLYPSPDGDYIIPTVEDDNGMLWAGSNNGVYEFDKQTGKYTFFPLSDSSTPTWSVYLDAEGILWAGSFGKGLFRMDTHTSHQFLPYNPDGLVNQFIWQGGICEGDGYLWLATRNGLQRIDKKNDQVITYQSDPSLPGSLSSNNITTVFQDRTGNLWVGTANGVNKASIRKNPFHIFQIIPTPSAFLREENIIASVLEDHAGTIWFTSKGLYRMDPATRKITDVVVNPNDPFPSLTSQSWPLEEDRQGRLWVGTELEKGLYQLDRASGKFIRYPCEFSVRMVEADSLGRLWIGGWLNDLAAFDPVTEQFTYYHTDENDPYSLIPGFINDVMVSRNGAVWVATSLGIGRLNPETGKFIRYQPDFHLRSGQLNDQSIKTLYEDQEGIIWIGTVQGGLNRFDPRSNTFTAFTTKEGLPSNNVRSITGGTKGNLWLGTNRGISRFNPSTNTFRNFDVSNGLPTNELRQGSIYSGNGKLMFGSWNGLVIFNPDSIKEDTAVPPVYLTDFKVMEKSLPLPTDKITLPYNQNFLSFDFVALNYDAPEKNQYAYQLVNLDKDWIYSGNRRFASYPDLAPGEYVFRVKAAVGDGIWNEQGASLQFTILPPWWRTWWAYGLYGIIGLCLLCGLRQYTLKRERLKNELKLQTLEAEKMHEVDHMKSRFFANISHEFRTPLTLILGPLQKFLARTPEESEDKPVYQMMQRNAQRLLHLINQLLDLSKLEAGSMTLEAKPAAIVPFLKGVILSFTSLAERQQIRYHFQYPTDNPVVYFDADKLEKILTNLLSNAFKFTPAAGEITVTAKLSPAAERAIPASFKKSGSSSRVKILEIKVQDSGKGIAEALREKIFDRFYQVDTSRTREQEGTGIGLSLVKELVELHGGEITVDSQPGQGANFIVAFPLLAADYEQITVEAPAIENDQPILTVLDITATEMTASVIEEAHIETPIVLVVEDNADVRAFIRQTLHPAYHTLEAADGLEGYQKALETIPDLILSDVMMPKMDGVALCHKLKAEEKTAHIPVILLTAKASGADKIDGLETGADDYITKPFEAEELLVRIKNLIEIRKKLREYYSRQITLEPKGITITSMDEQFLQKVMLVVEEYMDDASFGIDAFMREVGMSRMQLFRKLKALTDQSPGDFIRLMRLKRAAELLRQGAGNISEIAFQVGFQDPSYFTKCFQKQFGQTPSGYMATYAL